MDNIMEKVEPIMGLLSLNWANFFNGLEFRLPDFLGEVYQAMLEWDKTIGDLNEELSKAKSQTQPAVEKYVSSPVEALTLLMGSSLPYRMRKAILRDALGDKFETFAGFLVDGCDTYSGYRKIEAIKLARQEFKCFLKEANDFVEAAKALMDEIPF